MKFRNVKRNVEREYTERVVVLSSEDELAKELLKPITENKKSEWVFSIGEVSHPLVEVAQVKININGVGVVFANFDALTFTKEVKDQLFNKLLTLKGIDVKESNENLKKKIVSTFSFLDEYHPFYVAVDFENVMERTESYINSLGWMSYQIYVIKHGLPMLDIVAGESESKPAEEKQSFFSKIFKKKDNGEIKTVEQARPVVVEEKHIEQPITELETSVEDEPINKVKTAKKFGFKASMKSMFKNFVKNRIDFILNVLYTTLIGVCVLLSVIYLSIGNTGIGMLFVGFSVVSVALSTYNVFVYRRDGEDLKIFDHIFFIIFSVLGLVIGILIGWLIAATFINKGDTSVDFVKTILISVGISPVVAAAAHGLSFLVLFIYKKIKNRKKK